MPECRLSLSWQLSSCRCAEVLVCPSIARYLIRGTSPLEGKQPAKALDSQCFSRGRLNLAAQQLQRL